MSGKLIMFKGLPASGKSTEALRLVNEDLKRQTVRVNKDAIREQMFIKDWNYDKEKEVLRRRDFLISQSLSKGFTVISDDTNLAPKHETALRVIAKKYGAEFEINDSFLNTPLSICIERDRLRGLEDGGTSVGEKVITGMAADYLDCSALVPRTADHQIWLDLDGVMADFDTFVLEKLGIKNDREHEDPNFWDRIRVYPGRLFWELPRMPGALDLWEQLKPYKPIILTGIPWSIKGAADDKRAWVKANIDPNVPVVTCKSRDKRLYGKPGDILIDDWKKYQDLWEAMGGTFIHYIGDNYLTMNKVKDALGRPTIMEGSPSV